MKKFQILGILLIIFSASYTALAQAHSVSELSITPPTFIHEEYAGLDEYLISSIEYPLQSLNSGFHGAEIIRFSVTTTGNIDDITIINSVSREIDKTVKYALKKTRAYWKPGTIDGKYTAMERELVLHFVPYTMREYLQKARYYIKKGNKLLYEKNKIEKALAYYDKAYALLPNEVSTLTMKGFCLQKLGRDKEAAEVSERLGYYINQRLNADPTEEELLVFMPRQ